VVRRPDAAASLAARGVEILAGDLLDAASMVRSTTGCQMVVHAAGWTGGDKAPLELRWSTNVEGTANILAAAKTAGIKRFVHISSIAVYGLNCAPLIDESMATPFVGELYPDSKIAAESLVLASGLPYVIVRPASTYGSRGKGWTVGIIDQILHGLFLQGRDDGLVTPGYIDNVVDGLWLALTHKSAPGNIFNICDGHAVTYREFYLAYARMLGLDSLPTRPGWRVWLARTKLANLIRRLPGRSPVGPWSLHFRFNPSQYSIEHARHLLGYEPKVDFLEGMRRTEAWLRTNGYLS
jgi:nucleoside-diphosphate-sugar epimerase